jgi:hypothetical protein
VEKKKSWGLDAFLFFTYPFVIKKLFRDILEFFFYDKNIILSLKSVKFRIIDQKLLFFLLFINIKTIKYFFTSKTKKYWDVGQGYL